MGCRAGDFYSRAGVACPPCRALADHFLFAINTDFQDIAVDFAHSSSYHLSHTSTRASMVVPLVVQHVCPLADAHGAPEAQRQLCGDQTGQVGDGIARLRKLFEATVRVRPFTVPLCIVCSVLCACGHGSLHFALPLCERAFLQISCAPDSKCTADSHDS